MVKNLISNVNYPAGYFTVSKTILETALMKVPAYKAWRDYDPGPRFPISERFAAMPAVNKKFIRENFPDRMLPEGTDLKTGLNAGKISLVETSGTTDDKITNIWNQEWWDASERASWKLNTFMGRIADGNHREAILANPRNVGFISDEGDLPPEKRRLARFLYLNEKTDPTTWTAGLMDRMIAELAVFQPEVLEANPSLLARLCRYIAVLGIAVFQPGIIVFTYEYPTILQHRQIRRVFNAPLCSSYGTTETGYVFMQCEKGKYHQNSDFCRVDFQPLQKEHGGPQLGRILVTPLHNPWNYMLRFETGDLVTVEEGGRCDCGRDSGLVLSHLNGRIANLTLTCSGRLVTLYELDEQISRLENIDLYKLVQSEPGVYVLHLASRRPDKENIGKEAVALMKELYGSRAEVSISHDKDIKPEGSGKYLNVQRLFPIDIESYLDKEYLPAKA